MSHEMRWAARYAFVDDLWRGRPRVFVDRHLQAVLRRRGTGVALGLDPALAELVDAMLPRSGSPDPVWMAVDDPQVAAELARARPGTNFGSREAISDILRRGPWEVAILDLGEVFEHASGLATGAELAQLVSDTLEGLGVVEAMRTGARCVVLAVPARDEGRPGGLEYGDVTDLVATRLGGGRVYGLYEPPMVGVVDFAENIDPARARGSVDDEVDDLDTMAVDLPPRRPGRPGGGVELDPEGELEDEDDVPLSYDNSLGSQEPPLLEFVAVAGNAEYTALLSEGLSLLELPATSASGSVSPGVRAQLVQARREADAAAIERQAQLERADELERENFGLRRQLDEVRAEFAELQAEAPQREPGADEQEAIDAVLAREQSLRWRISQLEGALIVAQARPVEDLEAEIAELRARLEAAGASPPPPVPKPEALFSPESPLVAQNGVSGRVPVVSPAAPATRTVIRGLHGLVCRIERGGIGTLELRRELVALRRRLQSEMGAISDGKPRSGPPARP